MRAWQALCMVLICGLAATAEARPRTTPDRLLAVDRATGQLQLATAGAAVLSGIRWGEGQEADWPATPAEVEVKQRGTDRYGRAELELFLPGAAQPLQVALLRQGAAFAYDKTASPAAWLAAEREARRAGRGLWATPPLATADAPRRVGTVALLQGTVTRTYKARDAYYVNFGDDWKTDFSIKVPRRAWRSFGTGLEVKEGSTVLARGAIVRENGPMLVLTRPEQWEVSHGHTR